MFFFRIWNSKLNKSIIEKGILIYKMLEYSEEPNPFHYQIFFTLLLIINRFVKNKSIRHRLTIYEIADQPNKSNHVK